MATSYENITALLKTLSQSQKQGLVQCIQRDQSLIVCLGREKIPLLNSIRDIDSIINGTSVAFCIELTENPAFASTFKTVINRIICPDDLVMDFLDFRMECWPEE